MNTRSSKNPREPQRNSEAGADSPPVQRTSRAARGPQTQRENQQQLGVNPEHKTETMRRRHRGTFP